MTKLFVYGTLKKGYGNHHILDGAKLIGNARMYNAVMYSLGGFPGLQKTASLEDYVDGELYDVDAGVLKRCDMLEGHPDFYIRKDGLVHMQPSQIPTHPTHLEECQYYEYPHSVDKKHQVSGHSW